MKKLRALRDFERQHLGFLRTMEDYNLLREIGFHQAEGSPLTLKQLFLLDIGSVATVQRRLRRLRQLGVVHQQRSELDARAVEFTLAPRALRLLEKYCAFLS